MPIYEFVCSKCKKKVERLCKISERFEQECECGTKLDLQLSSFGGYYINGNNSASVRPKGAGSATKKND